MRIQSFFRFELTSFQNDTHGAEDTIDGVLLDGTKDVKDGVLSDETRDAVLPYVTEERFEDSRDEDGRVDNSIHEVLISIVGEVLFL